MPQWWERLFGRPTIDRLAHLVAAALQARGSPALTFDPAQRELRTGETPPRIYYLGNVFSDFVRASRAQRPAVVARFVEALAAAEEAMPFSYAVARPHLMPVVRGAGEDDLARLQARRSGATESEVATFHPAARPLFGELTVGLAYDTPHAIQRLSTDQLADWGIAFDDALRDALDNLRARPETPGWVPLAHGVWSGQWGDDYESSRLLLPDLIHRLGVHEPVVLTPLRRMLLVTGARNEAGLAEMARVSLEALQEQPRWLSVTPMKLGDSGWEPFEPPPDSAPAFAELAAIERAERYATQKAALDDLHARDGVDVFAADVTLWRSPDGSPRAVTTWTRGVTTWLPRADLVVLVDGEVSLTVPWGDLRELAGALMAPLDMQPERFEVTAFPEGAAWAALATRGV
jgi:hypothetical protein